MGNNNFGINLYRVVKKYYATNNPTKPSKVMVFERILKCNGVVKMESKSNKGVGSRSRCVECGMLTSIFCIVCKKCLCNPQSAANRSDGNSEDPKYFISQSGWNWKNRNH